MVDPWAVRLRVLPTLPAPGPNVLRGRVAQIALMGGIVRVTVDCDPPVIAELSAESAGALGLEHGTAVAASWSPEAARLVVSGQVSSPARTV